MHQEDEMSEDYPEQDHPEPGVVSVNDESFSEGELHIRYEEKQADMGIDEERLAEEFSEL